MAKSNIDAWMDKPLLNTGQIPRKSRSWAQRLRRWLSGERLATIILFAALVLSLVSFLTTAVALLDLLSGDSPQTTTDNAPSEQPVSNVAEDEELVREPPFSSPSTTNPSQLEGAGNGADQLLSMKHDGPPESDLSWDQRADRWLQTFVQNVTIGARLPIAILTTFAIQVIALALSFYLGKQLVALFRGPTGRSAPQIGAWLGGLTLRVAASIAVAVILTPFLVFSILFSFATFHRTMESLETIQSADIFLINNTLERGLKNIRASLESTLRQEVDLAAAGVNVVDDSPRPTLRDSIPAASWTEFENRLATYPFGSAGAVQEQIDILEIDISNKLSDLRDTQLEIISTQVEFSIQLATLRWEHNYLSEPEEFLFGPNPKTILIRDHNIGCDPSQLLAARGPRSSSLIDQAGILELIRLRENSLADQRERNDYSEYEKSPWYFPNDVWSNIAEAALGEIQAFLVDSAMARLESGSTELIETFRFRRFSDDVRQSYIDLFSPENAQAEEEDRFADYVKALDRVFLTDSAPINRWSDQGEPVENAVGYCKSGAGPQSQILIEELQRLRMKHANDISEQIVYHEAYKKLSTALAQRKQDLLNAEGGKARLLLTTLRDIGIVEAFDAPAGIERIMEEIEEDRDMLLISLRSPPYDRFFNTARINEYNDGATISELPEIDQLDQKINPRNAFNSNQKECEDLKGAILSINDQLGVELDLDCDVLALQPDHFAETLKIRSALSRLPSLEEIGITLENGDVATAKGLGAKSADKLREVSLGVGSQVVANILQSIDRTIAQTNGEPSTQRSWALMGDMLSDLNRWFRALFSTESSGEATKLDYKLELFAFSVAITIDVMIVVFSVLIALMRRSVLSDLIAGSGGRVDEDVLDEAIANVGREDPQIYSTIVQNLYRSGQPEFPSALSLTSIHGHDKRRRVTRVLNLLGNHVKDSDTGSDKLLISTAAHAYLESLASEEKYAASSMPSMANNYT